MFREKAEITLENRGILLTENTFKDEHLIISIGPDFVGYYTMKKL